jgi:multidrug efflux pump
MNFSRLFVLRPVATLLIMLAILLSGWLAYRLLPLSALPQVDYPTIEVTTLYPGASPDVITSTITAPLERQFSQMPGLSQMSSSNSAGASVVTLRFSLTTSLDVAEQQVQAAINAAANFLPTDLPVPPIYNKVNPADAPILTLALTSQSIPMTKVEDYADTRFAQKISQLPGVGLVSISGGQRPAVRIQVNPTALASRGLSLENIRSIINASNLTQAKGSFDGPTKASSIDANDQLSSAQEYKNLIIAYANGAPVRLGDVADIVDDAENNHLAAWANRSPAVILNIHRQPSANVIEVVNEIREILPQIQGSIPSSIKLVTLTDRTTSIRASIESVKYELIFASALVVMIIFLFLRNLPATLIPALAIPISLIGTFGFMYLAGFSINNLTLMALTIATGFVVDDAVVMIENISRFIEDGMDPLTSALKGSKQMGFTIISLTISLIAVLIPLLFMGDVIGRIFREFSITLAITILISALVSLTLTPMLCSKLLKANGKEASKDHPHFFMRLRSAYAQALKVVLDHQKFTLWIFVGSLVISVGLYYATPKGFFPIVDSGTIQVITEASPNISFSKMAETQQEVADQILHNANVESLSSIIGVDGHNISLNTGRMLINLKPKNTRNESMHQILQDLQSQVSKVPGVNIYFQPTQDVTIEDKISKSQYQFMVEDASPAKLSENVDRILGALSLVKTIKNVATDIADKGLKVSVMIDRDRASQLGVTMAAIDNALYDAYGQRLISTIFTQSNQYRVVLELAPQFRVGPESLNQLYIPATNSSGVVTGQVPLSSIAQIQLSNAPLVINHLGQFPATTISFDLVKGSSLSEATSQIDQAISNLHLSPSTRVIYQGSAGAFRASLSNEAFLILAAIIAMYIVLGILYESYIHPITILSTLPSAGIGALLALNLSGNDLGVIGIIGIILLIGIVKKNAIIMIDFAIEMQRSNKMSAYQAIYEASLLRLRPILMTTFSALLGALPLMLGSGMGSELRHPLGISMVGGLIVSQVLTLFTTPVIYLFFDHLAQKLKSIKRAS